MVGCLHLKEIKAMRDRQDRVIRPNSRIEQRNLSAEGIEFYPEEKIGRSENQTKGRSPDLIQYQVSASNIHFQDKEPRKNKSHSEELLSKAISGEYSYGKLGLILGLASIIGGVILCLNGVVGSTSWTASVLGMKSQINDAAPGVVLFIVGLFMIWITKPNVKLKNLKG
jgi:hypothetical protein